MNIEKVIEKYVETVESNAFVGYEKDLAGRIMSALSAGYQNRLCETDMVKIIESVINGCKNLTSKSDQPYFELSTNAIFVHGYPKESGVEFDYYGARASTELGDIIFIASIIFNDQIYFEKFTISQFKKDNQRNRSISWNMENKKQLYLLSRFPEFRGVAGSIVPQKNFNLPNYSGCLGSYSLLYAPGDFAFVSGTRLDSYLGSRNKINGDDLFSIGERRDVINISKWHHWWHEWVHMIDVCRHFCRPHCNACFLLSPFNLFLGNFHFLGNCHFSMNVSDFVSKYLRLCIGEPTVAKIGKRNLHAINFLIELMSALKAKAIKDNLTDLQNFTEGFFKYRYANNEGIKMYRENIEFKPKGGGLGIIYTTINLGEGE
jgi:hypothetical protein